MTEDDTFLRLKRIDIQEMFNLWMASPIQAPRTHIGVPPDEVDKFFKQRGWVYHDWVIAYHEFSHRD